MKYIKFRGDSNILMIEIIEPKECPNYTYYYPDGITLKISRKTAIVKDNHYGDYFETLEKAIENSNNEENLFISEGKIFHVGEVFFKVKDLEEEIIAFKYKEEKELEDLLENLSFKYSISLENYITLESKEVRSLYEYKESLSK